MPILRPRCTYLEKENTVEINDLASAIQKTEPIRVQKLKALRREQERLVRQIQELKDQKAAYLDQLGILSEEEPAEVTMPVDYNDQADLPPSELASNEEANREYLIKNPTDPTFNYFRDDFRKYLPEIDKKLRDYNYRMRKLSLREQKVREDVLMILQRETAPRETNYA